MTGRQTDGRTDRQTVKQIQEKNNVKDMTILTRAKFIKTNSRDA